MSIHEKYTNRVRQKELKEYHYSKCLPLIEGILSRYSDGTQEDKDIACLAATLRILLEHTKQ